MSVEWTINGTPLAEAGLRIASGSFRSQGPSIMRLERVADYHAAELVEFGDGVTIARVEDAVSVNFFQGKVASVPKYASAGDEAHVYEIADAWEDLESTIYQEEWAIGSSSMLMPKFVFGITPDGGGFSRCGVGQMIINAINYAISVGVDLQLGTVPGGETPIPSQMENTSCAELIRTAMKLHPDWVAWIDHTTSPPTFQVTPVSSLTSLDIAVDGSAEVESFNCIKRDDLIPDGVRIIYEFATTIDDTVYRNLSEDKYPVSSPDGGPRVLQATIPLAGIQMQVQKSRVQVIPIPEDAADVTAKDFIRANFSHLSGLPDAAFKVVELTPSLVDEPADHPDPINPQATRLDVADVTDLPNQLVRGQIEDWMRRKVGKVKVACRIEATAAANQDERDLILQGTSDITVTGTNATTKIYKGITQWVAPEDIPEGLAQATYEAILSGCAYQGAITLIESEISATRYHGKKLNLTGGIAGWATMAAPIHSVDFDIDNGRTTIAFGPVPTLAPTDFLELQRILRYRPTKWWSTTERASNEHGALNDPSSAGDTLNGYDLPLVNFGVGKQGPPPPFSIREILAADASGATVTINPGWIREICSITSSDAVILHMPISEDDSTALNATPRPEFAMTWDDFLYCKYLTDKDGKIKTDEGNAPVIFVSSSEEVGTHYQPVDESGAGGSDGEYVVKLGQLTGTGAEDAAWLPGQNSDIEHYAELWTGENIGGGAKIWKDRDPSTGRCRFRTGLGRGSYTGDSPDSGTSEQIQVIEDGDNFRVMGNGKKNKLRFETCDGSTLFELEWNDGLIITPDGATIVVPGCDGTSSTTTTTPPP